MEWYTSLISIERKRKEVVCLLQWDLENLLLLTLHTVLFRSVEIKFQKMFSFNYYLHVNLFL